MAKRKQKPTVLYRIICEPNSWLAAFASGGKWRTWKRYKTHHAAEEATKALNKSKPKYYEFKLGGLQ